MGHSRTYKITEAVSSLTASYTRNVKLLYCPKALPTAQGLSLHFAQSQRYKARLAAFNRVEDLPNVHNEPYDNDVKAEQQAYDQNNPNGDLELNPDVQPDPSSPIMIPVAQSLADSLSEDEEDKLEDNVRYINDFVGAGLPYAERSTTNFEQHFELQRNAGDAPWTPFESEGQWELARWLMTSGVSQRQINEFLKLNKVY